MGWKNDRVKPVVCLLPMISTIRKLWSAIYLGCASSSTAQGDTLVVKQEQPELMAQSILRLQGMERSDLKHR